MQEGELETELRDGKRFTLRPGMTYRISDHGDAAHRSFTKTDARLFVVDSSPSGGSCSAGVICKREGDRKTTGCAWYLNAGERSVL